MSETLNFSIQLPVYPERVYRAWLDGAEQARITGSPASIEGRVGGHFSALDGAASGEITALVPHDRISQTLSIANLAPGGQIELRFEPTCTGTELVLTHSGIPNGKTPAVLRWWEETYFRPMTAYFDEIVGEYIADMGDG